MSVAAQKNVGVVDLDGVLAVADYSQQQVKALKANAEYKKILKDMKALEKELQALQKEGSTKSLTWSEEQKQQHVNKGQKKLSQLNQLANKRTAMTNDVENRVSEYLGPKIEKVVNEIIEEKGIGLIVNSKAVYFRTADFDISEEVVKRLNANK